MNKIKKTLLAILVLGTMTACDRNTDEEIEGERKVSTTIQDEIKMNAWGKSNFPEYIPQFDNKTFYFTSQTDNQSYWTVEDGQIAVYIKNLLPGDLSNSLILYMDKRADGNYSYSQTNINELTVQTWQVLPTVNKDSPIRVASMIASPLSGKVSLTMKNNKLTGSITDLKVYADYNQNFVYDGSFTQSSQISSILKGTSYRTYTQINLTSLNGK